MSGKTHCRKYQSLGGGWTGAAGPGAAASGALWFLARGGTSGDRSLACDVCVNASLDRKRSRYKQSQTKQKRMPVIAPIAGEELGVHVVAKNSGRVRRQQIRFMVACDSFSDPKRVSKNKNVKCRLQLHLCASFSKSARWPWHMPHVGSSSAEAEGCQ
jgi:hypothetical protein